MTHEEIITWAQDPANEDHPKYAHIMSELALIEVLVGQMHDHESPETMRKFYYSQGQHYHVWIAQQIAKELNEPVKITIGEDPGDNFFAKMRDAIKAMTKRKDPAGAQDMYIDEETNRMVCFHDIPFLIKIRLSLQSCNFLIDNFGWHTMRANEVADALANIRHNLMVLFEQSKNFEFRIKGTALIDVVEGVDWDTSMVKGRTYGNFAVDLCELRGKTREHKDTLN